MLKKSFGGKISKLLAFVMGISMVFGMTSNSVTVHAANDCKITNPRIDEYGKTTWDKVTFGSYYQNMEESEAEPVKWRILDIDASGNAFLLADEALDCKSFNEKSVGEKTDSDGNSYPDYSCTWESSTLRAWLNGIGDYENDATAFFNTAFSEAERADIKTTEVINEIPDYLKVGDPTKTDPTTYDKVYLLSTTEASNAEYGFDTTVTEESKTRQAKGTDHAYISGAVRSGLTDNYGSCNWWLRSFVGYMMDTTGIRTEGKALNLGYGTVFRTNIGVRPALHINLSSSYIKDAGKVTSDGAVTKASNRSASEYSKPVKAAGGSTTWDCVYFGKYKQNVTFTKKPIEWRVLSVNGDDAFLLADRIVDCKPFNTRYKEGTDGKVHSDYACTWETSSLRAWLNGTGDYAGGSQAFINSAFSKDEKNAIISTDINNDGSTISDRVYLLSVEEITNDEYGFGKTYKKADSTRTSQTTDYGYINGAARVRDSGYEGNGYWWLRSSDSSTASASYINFNGWVMEGGLYVSHDRFGVRPAMHIDLSKISVKTAGTVDSYGKITELTYAEQAEANSASEAAEKTPVDTEVQDNANEKDGNGNKTNQSDNTEIKDGTTMSEAAATKDDTTSTETAATKKKDATPKKTKVISLKSKKAKSFIVKWKKVKNSKGYELQYARNKKFSKGKKKIITSKCKLTVRKLKKGKTYYVRVRAYCIGSDGSRICGKWSSVKKVKIKR